MKTEILSAIVTCLYISIVGGLDHKGTYVNVGSDESRRLIEGHVVDPKEHKYVVRLQTGLFEMCTGTVVGDYWIVTAAQCIYKKDCKSIKIFPSTWQHGDTSNKTATQCWTHEEYTGPPTLYYDIGVIKSADNLLEGGEFSSIRLYVVSGTQFTPGTSAEIFGWGETAAGLPSQQLRFAITRVEDWDICNYNFKNRDGICTDQVDCPGGDIPRRNFCTRRQGEHRAGVCTHDIGGPVVIDTYLGGVVSSVTRPGKRRCVDRGFPMHVNVPDYLTWIYHIIDPDLDTRDFRITLENELPPEYQATHLPTTTTEDPWLD